MRRVGSTPQQRGSASGATCPDVFELEEGGDYLVIGKAPAVAASQWAALKEQGASIGPGEQAVIVPRQCLRDAARDIAGEESDDDAREMWQRFAAEVTARGWYLSVGCGTVHICIPGDGGPLTDQYVEVSGG